MSGDAVEMQSVSPAPAETERLVPAGPVLNDLGASIAGWGPAMLKLNPRLAQLRFDIVPRKVSEDNFWEICFKQAALALREKFAEQELQEGLIDDLESRLASAYASHELNEPVTPTCR
eukprot:TRINITY_DN26069_c0_g1_i1.p2 TRINITY_DN26069_c0_g1~~TRINITY_DN26069_c0_g1_i1.p2  ORF type:complete len:118 (-),score=20.41 TRINITY_DN26069_c0_g1_i1:218-571(-)